MSRITNNTTGTQPIIVIGLSGANLANSQQTITVSGTTDVNIVNATGVHSYTTFTDTDQRKLSTPASNEIKTNVVVDQLQFFGNAAAAANTAPLLGISTISSAKDPIDFKVFMAGNITGQPTYSGSGFVTSISLKTTPTAPIFVTPIDIAVDGTFTIGSV